MAQLHGQERHPSYVGPPTFLGCPFAATVEDLRSLKADVAVLGAPVDMGVVNRPGARFGPQAIRQADYFGRPAEDIYHMDLDVYPLQVLRVADFGDAYCPPSSLEKSHQAVERKVTQALEAGAIPLVLGGDHSITLPSATAVARRYGFGQVGIVHFDAHADTGPASYGGVLIAHGSPMRRLIESGAVPGRNFVQVGLRGYWPDRQVFAWMREQGMRWHTMDDILRRGMEAVLEEAVAQALDGPRYIYLSVDIDVLDPAYAPGTGTPEPGGLATAQLLRAVRRVATAVDLVAADVVEVSPAYDGPGQGAAWAAHRVALEVISSLAWRRLHANLP